MITKSFYIKKQELIQIKQYILVLIVFVGALLAGLVLAGAGEGVKKTVGVILIGLVALLGIIGLVESEESALPVSGKSQELSYVNYVIDGDTIDADDGIKVRLIGIDAPEQGECYYEQSKSMLKQLVEGKYVRLEKDISGTDRLRRLLRYVILPSESIIDADVLVNNYMIRYGYAKTLSIAPDKRYISVFEASRQLAADNREGLWGACAHEIEDIEYGEPNDLPPDPKCIIKGNVSKREYGRIYFTPDCYNYDQIKINFKAGEQYFCAEQDAIDAGFRKSSTCP